MISCEGLFITENGRESVVDEGERVQHGEIIGVYPGKRSSLPFLQIGGEGIWRGSCTPPAYTDKKVNKNFLIYKEIQMGSGAKSYMRKGFLIYEEMRKYFTIVSWLFHR